PRVIHESRSDADVAYRELHLFQFRDLDRAGKILPADREKRHFHLCGQNGGETGARPFISQNANLVLGFVGREKKLQPLNVIPMGVRQKKSEIDRRGAEFLFQGKTELSDTGPGVENNNFAIAANLDTGGVATITNGRWAGDRDRTADAPELDSR